MGSRPAEGAKVQALRAIFSEQNKAVMGLLPPGALRPRNDAPREPAPKRACSKPAVGPKPAHLSSQRIYNERTPDESSGTLTVSSKDSSTLNESSKDSGALNASSKDSSSLNESSRSSKTLEESLRTFKTQAESSRTFGDTIASFMFSSNKENEGSCRPAPPLPKPRISDLRAETRGGVIDSENYVCKSGFRRRPIPPLEELGPPPPRPRRPLHLRLPSDNPSQKSPVRRPNYPCPPRPGTPPPLPPATPASVIISSSLREEIEELYEDTLLGEGRRPVSLIPEYTVEEEEAELYNDAAEEDLSDYSFKLKKPPPPVPSEYLQPNMGTSTEELYQDTNEKDFDEFYEVMPCDEMPDDSGSPLYSNNKKEIEKLKKEEDKRIRKEQREKDKRQKELEKLRKKFGLTGEEIPIDDGLVKWDSRGGKGDLPVRKGETVLILRMEGNPTGRWLVKNEKGKIGYVELTNIEVDPLSVKSVMSIRRLSMMSAGEDLYCEAKSEEAIYEVTY